MSTSSSPSQKVECSASFWKSIKDRGGLLTTVRARGKRNYDTDLEAHVLNALGLSDAHITSALLKANKISLEKLVDAVFCALHPWAALMTETFEMFAQAGAQHGSDGIKIEIRLEQLAAGLRTTLAAFEEETRTVRSVALSSRGKQWGELDIRLLLSQSTKFLSSTLKAAGKAATPVTTWARHCRDWPRSVPGGRKAPPPIPTTGDQQFDTLAVDALALLTSFMHVVPMLGSTYESRLKVFMPVAGEHNLLLPDRWDARKVAMLDSDFFMISFYEALEHMALTRAFETDEDREVVDAWRAMIDAIPSGPSTEEQAEQVLSLLDLPSWKARHQLYAVWVATRIVKAAPWTPQWNIMDGTLNFEFGGAEILRFVYDDSAFVLRSELRRKLVGRSSGKRSKGIQPDFTLLHGTDEHDSPAHLVVECKQYQTSNRGNFRAALSDYSRSHPDADVLLANYGPVLESVSEGFATATQLIGGYGEMRPLGRGMADFDTALKSSFARAEKIVALERQVAEAREREALRQLFDSIPRAEAVKTNATTGVALAYICLLWADGGDLDLHVSLQIGAEQYEVNFVNRGRSDDLPFAVLDNDTMSGPGQETVTLYVPLQGELKIEVRRYSGTWPSQQPMVVLKKADGWSKTIVRPLGETSDLWEVCTLDADWLAFGLEPINRTS